ncbi:MAG: PEGA domain-containing protein [Caldisericia bacterium]|nr:PEGA domain-containing protein [Caldisericia bacterium]
MKRALLFAFIFVLLVSGCNADRSLTINIKSNPSPAFVYIDGECKGETPLNVELKANKHDVLLLKESFVALKESITVNKENLSFDFALREIPVKAIVPSIGSVTSTVSSNQRLVISESVGGDTKIHCFDLTSYRELWNYVIEGNPNISLKTIDNFLFAFSRAPTSFYIFDFNGNLLYTYKDIPFNFSDFDKNILVAYNFSSENSNNTSIWCYFLNVGKVIWSKDINLKNAILLPLDPHSNFIYFVGINGESVSLYKLNKLDGQIVSNYDFTQIHGTKDSETGRVFPSILGTFQDKVLLSDGSTVYCVDKDQGTIDFSKDTGFHITGWSMIDKYLFISGDAANKTVSIDISNGKIAGTYNNSFNNAPEYLGSQIACDIENGEVFIFDAKDKIHAYDINGKELSFDYQPCDLFLLKKVEFVSLKVKDGILFVEAHYSEDSAESKVIEIAYDTKIFEPIFSTDSLIYAEDNCVFYLSSSNRSLIFVDVQSIVNPND